MAINFIAVKCPECGANLSIESNRETAFCTYCGTKILIHNENEHIIKNVDVAKINAVENEKIIKLKELELAEKSDKEGKFFKNLKIYVMLFLGGFGLLLILISAFMGKYSDVGENLGYVGVGCIIFLAYMWMATS